MTANTGNLHAVDSIPEQVYNPNTGNKKEENRKIAFIQAARAEVEAMIKKLVQDATLQAEMIAKWGDALAEQRAKANQEAWDKLFQAMQAEIDKKLKAQPVEGFLPKQLNSVNPSVVSEQLQQFNTLRAEFAAERDTIVKRNDEITSALTGMAASLRPVLAPSAPKPKPEEHDEYVKKIKIVVAFGIELDSHYAKLNSHRKDMEDQSSAIDANLELVSESSADKPYLRSKAMEAHAYLSDLRKDEERLTTTITLNSETYNNLKRIMDSAFGIKMAPYSVAVAPGSVALANNPFILLNSPRGFYKEEEEKVNGLFSGYVPGKV